MADLEVEAVPLADAMREPECRMERPSSAQSISEWSDYGFRWLFNPHRFDHLPIEEQVLRYKHRNLLRSKVYKFGCRVFGQEQPRTRVIVAPAMNETEGYVGDFKPSRAIASEVNQQASEETNFLDDVRQRSKLFTQAEEDYRMWLKDRKKFRSDLENMGLNEEWLSQKPNKTALEQRVLMRLLQDKYPKPASPLPVVEEPLQAVLPSESPVICRPSPLAVQIIEKHLMKRRMRLVDLFKSVDKNKDWLVTREDFRKAIKKAKIALPDDLLEDLIITLDHDLDNKLDYRELAKGMGLWKVEKRETKRKHPEWSPAASSGRASAMSASSSKGGVHSSISERHPAVPEDAQQDARDVTSVTGVSWSDNNGSPTQQVSSSMRKSSPVQRSQSAISRASTSSSLLEVPPPDVRPERRNDSPEAFVDLRKRNREALACLTGNKGKPIRKQKGTTYDIKSMVRTGDVATDHHMQPSTLEGETAEQVDRFRQLRLQEYHRVCALCRENNVPLAQSLLEKVLLFPPDKSHASIRRGMRKPGGSIWSAAIKKKHKPGIKDKPDQENIAASVRSQRSGKRGRPTKVVMDPRGAYPTKRSVTAPATKMHLSTGRALVSRQVDCWLSYEEYEQLTRHLGAKYTQLHGHSDHNAFWPGHLLDKLRLCMPTAEPKLNSVFSTVRPEKRSNLGYNNDLLTWPVSDAGYVQYGLVDPYYNKY